METHTRYSALQPPGISSSTSDLWNALSQSSFGPSPSSSFTDLRELGVIDPTQCGLTTSSSETNLKSLELLSDRELTLDNIQRKLSLDFLNSNRRDIQMESEFVSRADRQERPVMGKDTAATLYSLTKPVLHDMATAQSISPLPGVHTFSRKRPEGVDTSRSPMHGEVPTDLGIQSHIPTYNEGSYQTNIDTQSHDVMYSATPQHLYSSGNYPTVHASVHDKAPTYDIPPPMITVAPDSTCVHPSSFPIAGSGGHDAFAVHVYPSSPSSSVDSTPPRFASRPMVSSVQHQHRNKEHMVFKSIDHQITQANYGRANEVNEGYYNCAVVTSSSPSSSSTSTAYTYDYSNFHFQDSNDHDGYSTTYSNRPIVVTTSTPHQVTLNDINGDYHVMKKTALKRPQTTNARTTNQCHICRKTYGRPSTLKTHVRTHLGDRPYHCQLCGKSFTQPANLTAHIRIHSGEKPFSCPVCARQFSQSSSLKTHMRTHSGERPYMCTMCKKSFADSSTLTKHRRTHTGEKPYQCNVCLQHFSQSGNLKRHMKVHTDS